MYWVSVFSASVNSSQLDAFRTGLESCYQHYGVGSAAASTERPEPGSKAILLHDAAGRAVGGTQVQLRGSDTPLPFEATLCRLLGDRAADFVDQCARPVAEACALWQLVPEERTGLAQLLVQLAIAVARTQNVRTLYGFTHARLGALLYDCGFQAVDGVPDLPYPNGRYRTRVYVARPQAVVTATVPARREIDAATRRLRRVNDGIPAYRTGIEQGAGFPFTLAEPRRTPRRTTQWPIPTRKLSGVLN